ncbi:CPBP family intramembrane metalloprotease domain-containing protein [Adhaeribacter arboris]|uniref:CPBP family intramembrane metalloprotease domain-containing protein n=1 Tax=Adhaeribacter arboris TaxID=2072846 RepID=A0A2T2YG62_9BACT|nr:type II CAAX endopeptidase family protein [Adhaeribacter arboris]PSR54507.1 CPBP family intramembrane metalloprotease domain-containing protein [Adhaeribacter arboris]
MIISITKQKILKSVWARIIFGLIICLASIIIGQQIFLKIPGIDLLQADSRNLIKGIFVSILAISSYWLFYSNYEKRAIRELSVNGFGKKLFAGILIGSGLQSLTILVISVYGSFKIIAINPVSTMIIPFTVAFTVAIIEEILLRGIVFRITEEKWGSTIALIISGATFGGLHLVNPHVTLLSVLCVTVVGVLLGAAYMYYKNLWVPIAIHFAWNFTQNGIFGAITSGNEKTSSLLTSEINGPKILTGGQFGPEGSIQAVLLCFIVAMVIIRQLHKQHKLVKFL